MMLIGWRGIKIRRHMRARYGWLWDGMLGFTGELRCLCEFEAKRCDMSLVVRPEED